MEPSQNSLLYLFHNGDNFVSGPEIIKVYWLKNPTFTSTLRPSLISWLWYSSQMDVSFSQTLLRGTLLKPLIIILLYPDFQELCTFFCSKKQKWGGVGVAEWKRSIKRRIYAQNSRQTKNVKYAPCSKNVYIPSSFNFYSNTIYFIDEDTGSQRSCPWSHNQEVLTQNVLHFNDISQ